MLFRSNPYDPNANQPVPKSKKIMATVFCGVSNFLMVAYLGYWGELAYEILNEYRDDLATAKDFTTLAVFLYVFFLFVALALSIVAKVLYRKSKWAVINFVLLGAILAFALIVSPIVVEKGQANRQNKEELITEELNSEIENLMEEYSFDVMDLDEDFIDQMDGNFEIWIYVSSEASSGQIS